MLYVLDHFCQLVKGKQMRVFGICQISNTENANSLVFIVVDFFTNNYYNVEIFLLIFWNSTYNIRATVMLLVQMHIDQSIYCRFSYIVIKCQHCCRNRWLICCCRHAKCFFMRQIIEAAKHNDPSPSPIAIYSTLLPTLLYLYIDVRGWFLPFFLSFLASYVWHGAPAAFARDANSLVGSICGNPICCIDSSATRQRG